MKKGLLVSILVATAASVLRLSGVLARVPQAAPESEGFSSERLARISAVMRAEIDKGTLPGAVTIIARNGKVVHFEAHGYLDAGKAKPMTQDAVFRMFSMVKPFVSVVTMMGRAMSLTDLFVSEYCGYPDCIILRRGFTPRLTPPRVAGGRQDCGQAPVPVHFIQRVLGPPVLQIMPAPPDELATSRARK